MQVGSCARVRTAFLPLIGLACLPSLGLTLGLTSGALLIQPRRSFSGAPRVTVEVGDWQRKCYCALATWVPGPGMCFLGIFRCCAVDAWWSGYESQRKNSSSEVPPWRTDCSLGRCAQKGSVFLDASKIKSESVVPLAASKAQSDHLSIEVVAPEFVKACTGSLFGGGLLPWAQYPGKSARAGVHLRCLPSLKRP